MSHLLRMIQESFLPSKMRMTSRKYKIIYKWQQINNMQFIYFELLRYGKNQDIYFGSNSRKIEQTQCVKDLCVKMSDALSFTEHIDTICTKVRQKCGWIIRTFHPRGMHTMKTLLCSIVQPRLDYCLLPDMDTTQS